MSSTLLSVLAVLLPQSVKRFLYNRVFGWEIDRTATIGMSILHGGHFRLGPDSHIGHGNIIKGIGSFELAEGGYVKNFNHVFGQDLPDFPDRSISIGARSLVMSRHFFDVSGTISIGADCTIGGRDSQFWSHSRFTGEDGVTSLEPRDLVIGDDVYVGARATLIHCTIPDGSIVGAAAVVTKQFSEPGQMIVGNPAQQRVMRSRS